MGFLFLTFEVTVTFKAISSHADKIRPMYEGGC